MVRAASLRIRQSLPIESDLQNWFHATVTDYKRFAVPFNSSLSSLLPIAASNKASEIDQNQTKTADGELTFLLLPEEIRTKK